MWVNDSDFCNTISRIWGALSLIAWSTAKLGIVDNNTTIMNAIASNGVALGSISDSDFFTYILENSTYLTTCAWSSAWASKINSYEADDLLPAIYSYTWDLWYNTFAELAEDDTAMETVEASTEAMLIIDNNSEASSYMKWKPWANTLLYMPLNWDLLDYSWNNNNGTAYWTVTFNTVENRQYAYTNNSAITLTSYPVWTWNPNDFTFVWWAKLTPSTWYCSIFHMWSDSTSYRFNLIINYRWWSGPYQHIMDLYSWNIYLSQNMNSPQYPWEWVCVVYTYEKSTHTHTLYLNNVQSWQSNSYSLNIWSSFKYIWRPNSWNNCWLAEIIFESWIWTAEQRTDYYNKTKKQFWLT